MKLKYHMTKSAPITIFYQGVSVFGISVLNADVSCRHLVAVIIPKINYFHYHCVSNVRRIILIILINWLGLKG